MSILRNYKISIPSILASRNRKKKIVIILPFAVYTNLIKDFNLFFKCKKGKIMTITLSLECKAIKGFYSITIFILSF